MSFNNKLKFTASSIALISAALHPSIASSVPLDENVSVISSNTYTADGREKDMYDMRNGLDITGGTLEVKNEAAVIETSGNALNISGGNVKVTKGELSSGTEINIFDGNVTLSTASREDDFSILHLPTETGDINISGGNVVVKGKGAQIERIGAGYVEDLPSAGYVVGEGNINITGGNVTISGGGKLLIGPSIRGDININDSDSATKVILNGSSTIENNNIYSYRQDGMTDENSYDINISGQDTQVTLNGTSKIISGADKEFRNELKAGTSQDFFEPEEVAQPTVQNHMKDIYNQLVTVYDRLEGRFVDNPSEVDLNVTMSNGELRYEEVDPLSNINITDGAKVILNGSSQLVQRGSAGGDIIIDNASLEANGTNNAIGNTIVNNGGRLSVGKDGNLHVNQNDDGTIEVNDSTIAVAGKIFSDIVFNGDSKLIYTGSNGRIVGQTEGLKNLSFENDASGKTSEMIGSNKFEDLENIYLVGNAVDITIDDSTSIVSTDDEGELEEGIISGKLDIRNNAKLTVLTDFANAETIVDWGSELNYGTEKYGNSLDTYKLSLTNESSANITNTYVNGKSRHVDVGGDGLIVTASELETKDTYIDMTTSNIEGSNITADNSVINGDKTNITDSSIVANNASKIGSVKRVIRSDEDGLASDPLADMQTYGEFGVNELKNDFNVNVSSSDITLSNGSSLENTMYADTTCVYDENELHQFKLSEKMDVAKLDELKAMTNAGGEDDETWQMNLGFVDQVKGSINIGEGSTVTLDTASSIENNLINVEGTSGDIIISDEQTKITVLGKGNKISATGGVFLENSAVIEVGDNAELTVSSQNNEDFNADTYYTKEVDDEGNHISQEVQYDMAMRGNTKLILGGEIKGNIYIDNAAGDTEVVMTSNAAHIDGIIENMDNLTISGDINTKTSQMMNGNNFADVKNLIIKGENTNLTIDSDPFYITENHQIFEKHYQDDGSVLTSHNIGGEYECEEYAECNFYTNEIDGNVNVKEGATVTLDKEFAADNFNVDDATLNANALIKGNVNVTNGGSFNFDGTNGASIMLLDKISADGKKDGEGNLIKQGNISFTNLARADIGQIDVNNSKLSIKNGWYQTGPNNLLNLGDYENAMAQYNDKPFNFKANIANSEVELENAKVKMWETDVDNTTIMATGDSHLSGDRMSITDSTIIADGNVKIGSLKTPVVRAGDGEWQKADNRYDGYSKDEYRYLSDYLTDEEGNSKGADVIVSGSNITLKGASSLENSHYNQSFTDEEKSELTFVLDKVIDRDTAHEMLETYNGGKWNIFWDGYDEKLATSWEKNIEDMVGQEGQIEISDGSIITLEGTSQIANNMINTEGNSGDVIVSGENTKVIAKGSNNKITATSGIEFIEGASLEVAKGASLTAEAKGEEETYDVWFDESSVKVDGTFNASMSMINSNLDVNGGTVESDADINFSATDITVSGTSSFLAEGNIDINDQSTLEIAKDSTLTTQSQSPIAINNSSVIVGGTLHGDLEFSGTSSLTLTSNQAKMIGSKNNLSNFGIQGGEKYETSNLGEFSDLQALNVEGSKTELNINSESFKNSDETMSKWYSSDDGYNKHVSEYDPYDDSIKAYDNQLAGDLAVTNGATVSVNAAFSAPNVNVSNGSSLNVNNLLYADVDINSGSSINVNAPMTDIINIPTLTVTDSIMDVKNTDGLILGDVKDSSQAITKVFSVNDSRLNIENSFVSATKEDGEYKDNILMTDLIKSTATLKDAALTSESLHILSSNVNANNSVISGDNVLRIATKYDEPDKRSQVTLTNTKLGSIKAPIRFIGEDEGYETTTLFDTSSSVEISDTDIVMKGNSSIESSFYTTDWENDYKHRFGNIKELITNENVDELFPVDEEYGYPINNYTPDEIREHTSTIDIANSDITMEGTSSVVNNTINTDDGSGDINFDATKVIVKGQNTISATGNIEFNNASTLEVVKGASLTTDDNEGAEIYVNGSSVKLGGKIKGDLNFDDDSTLYYTTTTGNIDGTVSGLQNLGLSDGVVTSTSAIMSNTKYTDLANLNIDGQGTNLTINSGSFKASDENEQKWYRIEDGFSKHVFDYDKPGEEYREPAGEDGSYWEIDDDGERDDLFKVYDNQIVGTLNIDNGATLNVNSTFAAPTINVANNSKLNINELMYGNFNINTGSTVTVNGRAMDRMNVPTFSATDSTVIINNLDEFATGVAEHPEYVEDYRVDEVFSLNNSSLKANTSFISTHKDNQEMHDGAKYLLSNITDSTVELTDSAFSSEYLDITSSNITAKNSVITGNNNIYLSAKDDNLKNRNKVTLNNSKLGSIKRVIKYLDEEDGYESGTIIDENSDVQISDTDIVMKGNSSIESSMYVTSWEAPDYKHRFGSLKTMITDENVDELLPIDDEGYPIYSYTSDYIRDHESTINISDSKITMEGTSSIANNNITQGDIVIDNTYITTKGNNAISATGEIIVQNDSTLDILKGSTLTAISKVSDENGYDMSVNDRSTIKVGGTLDGKVKFDDTSSLLLANGGKIASEEISGLKNFGLDGNLRATSNNVIQTVFKDLKSFSLIGSKDDRGRYTAPNFTLNSQIFKTDDTPEGYNEIAGNLIASNGAVINIQTDLIAEDIIVDNGATLTTGKDLNANLNTFGEKSKATIDGAKNKANYNLTMRGAKSYDKGNIIIKNVNDLMIGQPTTFTYLSGNSSQDIIADNANMEFNGINNLYTTTALATNGGKIDFKNIKNMSGTLIAEEQSIINFDKVESLISDNMDILDSQLNISSSTLSQVDNITLNSSEVNLSKNSTFGGNSINIENETEVVLNDTSKLNAEEGSINISENSVVTAKGKANDVSADSINVTDAVLNIAKGATLDLNGNTNFEGATLKLAGTLNANGTTSFDDYSKLVYTDSKGMLKGNADVSSLKKIGIEGNVKTLSSMMFKDQQFSGLDEFSVTGSLNSRGKIDRASLTINSAMFNGSIEGANYYYDPIEKEYVHYDSEKTEINQEIIYDCDEYGCEEEGVQNVPNPEEVLQEYANQLAGDLNIENADVKINSDFAAENINVGVGGTLTTANALIYGNLNVNGEGAKATVNGKDRRIDLKDISVTDNATLTLDSIEDMDFDSLYVEDSTLNLTKYGEGYNLGAIDIVNSQVNSTGFELQSDLSVNVENSKIKLDNSKLYADLNLGDNTLEIHGFNTLNLSKNSLVSGDMSAYFTDITVNDNSRIEGNISLDASNLVLNKNSSIGASGAEDSSCDIDINYGSNVTMNGTSSIITSDDEEGYYGSINIDNYSKLAVNGKNKIVSGDISIYDSVLDIAKGATLDVVSNGGKELSFSGESTLKLVGTLNADLYGSVSTLVLGKTGVLNGDTSGLYTSDLVNFGVSGATDKDVATLYDKYKNQWFGSEEIDKFIITDKSKVTLTGDLQNELGFYDVYLDNGSTLTTKAGDTIDVEGSIYVGYEGIGSTLNISNGTKLTAEMIDTHAANVNINGSALKKGETEYQTKINAGVFAVGNIDNPKAKVNIKNAEMNLDYHMAIANTKTATLTNVDLNADKLYIYSQELENDKKGNPVYNTTSLTNVKGIGEIALERNKLVIGDSVEADRLTTAGEFFGDEGNKTYIDFKGNNVKIAQTDLQDEATLAIASGKNFDSEISLGENAQILLKGNLSGSVLGDGTLDIQNAKSKVDAIIDGIKLSFGRIKTSLKDMFTNSEIYNVKEMKLNGSTITVDKDLNYVDTLTMDKATLTLANNLELTDANINSSKLYLGTNTLDVGGEVDISNKSSIFLNVDDADTYGKIIADTINLEDKTTSMSVTLKKGVDLSDNNGFNFLEYNNVNGELGKVTIANNRYKFTEVNVGQFTAEETSTGRGVIERFDASKQNLAVAAMHLVDDETSVTSTSEVLNALSQKVGGEKAYASSLETVNADDTGLVQNTSNEVSQTVTNAALSQMTGGNSNAIQGMSSGDEQIGGSMWVKTLYNHSELENTSKYNGFTGNTTGIAFGGDKMVSDDVKLGLGYGFTQSRVKNDIRTSDVDTHTLMLYGEYKPSQWFVNGVFSYGWSDYSQKASNGIVSVKSDFDVYAAALLLNTGYEARVNKSTVVTPYVGMRYLNVDQDSYVDSDNKHIATDKSDLLTLTASTKVKTDFELGENTTITPEARLGVTYDVVSDGANSIVSLSNGASYKVESRRLDRFGVEFGAGVSAYVNDNWEITAGYEGKFKQDYQDHTGTFDIRYNF